MPYNFTHMVLDRYELKYHLIIYNVSEPIDISDSTKGQSSISN